MALRPTQTKGPREAPCFANIILATLVLIENKLTLVEMPRLLTDPYYRNALLQRTVNPEVVLLFQTHYDRWGREQALIAESVLNKVGALENAQVRVIFGAGRQTARALVEEVYLPETGVPSQGERESLAE